MPATVAAATATWTNNFLQGGRLPIGFTCVDDGPERGVVKLRGSFLFADFDLMAINRASVVLPEPGGPHRIIDLTWSRSMA